MSIEKMLEKLIYLRDILGYRSDAPVTYADLAFILEAGIEENIRKQFVPPTLDAVKAYCAARGNKIDPERFWNHYEASKWIRGKNTPIKDWQACIRTWEKMNVGGGFVKDQSMFEQEEGRL